MKSVVNQSEYAFLVFVFICCFFVVGGAVAQGLIIWSPIRTIDHYHPETNPPILIADTNKKIHAFSHQQVGQDQREISIIYNFWRHDYGWSAPIDIILSTSGKDARLLGAILDNNGVFHLAFFDGDDTGANIFYSSAHYEFVDQASGWSTPIRVGSSAITPESGRIVSDGAGNLIIIYNGKLIGNGFYSVRSEDGGVRWSEPEEIFLTFDQSLHPYGIEVYSGESGLVHAVWSVNDLNGHGDAIYYSRYDSRLNIWSAPFRLAENIGGLGTLSPVIIEHKANVLVFFYSGHSGHLYFRKSQDLGENWLRAYAPFPHIGSNGTGDFVVDSSETLHFIWAQRISGPPDVHGVWHSTWQQEGWTPYEQVNIGRKVLDREGFSSYDPVTTRAVVSQGNLLMVTWRTDPGSRGNGIWYSFGLLDSPEIPISNVERPQNLESTKIPEPDQISITETPEIPRLADLSSQEDESPAGMGQMSTTEVLLISLIPVLLLIILVVTRNEIVEKRHTKK